MENPFDLTDSAAVQVKKLMERENPSAETLLRVKVVGGGCSGLSYKLEFEKTEESAADGDQNFVIKGVSVIIDPKSLLFVKGTILDFSDGLNGQGFVFNNPNAKTSCGCGSSFSTWKDSCG